MNLREFLLGFQSQQSATTVTPARNTTGTIISSEVPIGTPWKTHWHQNEVSEKAAYIFAITICCLGMLCLTWRTLQFIFNVLKWLKDMTNSQVLSLPPPTSRKLVYRHNPYLPMSLNDIHPLAVDRQSSRQRKRPLKSIWWVALIRLNSWRTQY